MRTLLTAKALTRCPSTLWTSNLLLDVAQNVPIDDCLNATSVGRVGEYLTAFYLESLGIDCTIVDRRGTDIYCRKPDGTMFTLEVKSAQKHQNKKRAEADSDFYAFRVNNKAAEWYAFVDLNSRLVLFKHRDELSQSGRANIRVQDFTEKSMRDGLKRLIEAGHGE
jgi:hypothetical protein